ncbi:unnamed protein product [Tilletia controversa]|uniref:Uncharacterized protein n=1 Tax=Tilletia controversa TaxID=13291 RepID=A0A8X7MPN0_9BASI|nr:hypothetical protein CF328_g5598 [Tilletia controversa]KAE8243158.1 hypothetical protein A4X06_0g6510 [Tilletia controversa]CAD6915286.1 unnamed protein product [Tilletia controversa]CAD6916769.1 unnamed protein product [Tilletia controversa]CAD6920180.1 unnamed protein product [Tilletia controversa]
MVEPSPLHASTATHTGQTASTTHVRSASAAHLRSLEERVASVEEQLRASSGSNVASQSTPFSTTPRQRKELSRLGRNPNGGPSAPPISKKQSHTKLRRHFRRLVYVGYGSVRGGKNIVRLLYPTRGSWPRHASSSQSISASASGETQTAEEELTSGNQLRLHFGRPYNDPINQTQLRSYFKYMLAHRHRCGVPADMTLEELIVVCATTFDGWATAYTRSLSSAGRRMAEAAKARACHAARRARKATARAGALRLHRYYFFSDGAKVPKTPNDAEESRHVRRGAVRADVEFAAQPCVMSDEEEEDEPADDDSSDNDGMEPDRVRRRVAVEWRSACLVTRLEGLDKKRKRQPYKRILPPTKLRTLPPGFTLPSSIRRWMVARSWAEQNQDDCVDVSDNAGPFQGPYSVTNGAKDWGEDPDWSMISQPNQLDDEENGDDDVLAGGSSSSSSSRRRRGSTSSTSSTSSSVQRLLDAEFGGEEDGSQSGI